MTLQELIVLMYISGLGLLLAELLARRREPEGKPEPPGETAARRKAVVDYDEVQTD